MAIYYKFKSAKAYDTISMDGPFISVGFLKEKIYETKHLGSGKDLDIVISNAQTNEGLSSSFIYLSHVFCSLSNVECGFLLPCIVCYEELCCRLVVFLKLKSEILFLLS